MIPVKIPPTPSEQDDLLTLFIRMKLDVRDLIKREVWVGTLSHMALWTLLGSGFTLLLGTLAMALFAELALHTAALVGFALS